MVESEGGKEGWGVMEGEGMGRDGRGRKGEGW